MPLTFVEREDTYSVYLDSDGDEVLISHGPGQQRVVHWEDYDLHRRWSDYLIRHRYIVDRQAFTRLVKASVTVPEDVFLYWCERCEEPGHTDDGISVGDDGGMACQSCYDDYYRDCDRCDTVMDRDSMTYTLHESYVCQGCLDRAYQWCQECDGYHHADDAGDHRHGGCDCETPAPAFTMRNDGDPVLQQDERVTVALPAGTISQEGIWAITRLITDQGYAESEYDERCKWWRLASLAETELGDRWQTKEGNYTKRLSKLAHKSEALKVPPALLSSIGCIARDHSTAVDFQIEVTRDFNQSAADFFHEDSCWWSSYYEGRCALKSNGGIGMRTWSENGRVAGRAWIMPLRRDGDDRLVPTFESLEPDAFVVFNGYGDLSGYAPARILSHMAGMTYRKIGFTCSMPDADYSMYVNGDSGYLVAPEEIATNYTDGSLRLSADKHSNLYNSEKVLADVA